MNPQDDKVGWSLLDQDGFLHVDDPRKKNTTLCGADSDRMRELVRPGVGEKYCTICHAGLRNKVWLLKS